MNNIFFIKSNIRNSLVFYRLLAIAIIIIFGITAFDVNFSEAQIGNAQFVSQSVPATMTAGQTYSVSVTMENTGTSTWTNASNYKLGSQNPQDNTTWGLGRVDLAATDSITPGQHKTFVFNITVPLIHGTYNFQWRMLREAVEWFGDLSPNAAVTVSAPNSEPAILWLARSSNTKGVWALASTYRATGPGEPCASGHGWLNTPLFASKINADGSNSEKVIQMNCSRPWGSPQAKVQILNGYWAMINNANLHGNPLVLQEEVMPDPGLIFTPLNVVPDGQWHTVIPGCYIEPVYINNFGSGSADELQCYDAVCQTTESPCPGANTLTNVKYIIYNSCEDLVCDDQAVPVKFYQRVFSVMRVAYTAVAGCGGPEILTEEQWFIKNYGYAGFVNTNSGPNNPSAVDIYALDDEQSCLPFWDYYCPKNNECLGDTTPPAAPSGVTVS